jgi:hypothetical protein
VEGAARVTRAAVILSAGLCLTLAACTQPRAHAALHVGGGKVRVAPSLSTTIAGIGLSVSQ